MRFNLLFRDNTSMYFSQEPLLFNKSLIKLIETLPQSVFKKALYLLLLIEFCNFVSLNLSYRNQLSYIKYYCPTLMFIKIQLVSYSWKKYIFITAISFLFPFTICLLSKSFLIISQTYRLFFHGKYDCC